MASVSHEDRSHRHPARVRTGALYRHHIPVVGADPVAVDIRRVSLAFVVTALATLITSAQDLVRVERVIDGDTIIVENVKRVRLLGVNTPETKHPQKKVEAFSKVASDFTKQMVELKLVRVELNQLANRRNTWSRTLAYVFLSDGTFLKAEIIREGYGFAIHSSPPLEYEFQFRKLEQARCEHNAGYGPL